MRKTLAAALLSSALFIALPVLAAEEKSEALLQADTFEYDQNTEVFNAIGHVELMQDGQIVRAERMSYDRLNDKVIAEGNVVFMDTRGQAYFAERVELQQKLKQGIVDQIGLVMADGSRFAARQGEQIDENHMRLRDAVYSPCNLCEEDPSKPPMWQMRAGKILHDKEEKNIYYHRAKLEAYGVPVFYTPYFSHPDPSVKSRSGFLMPKVSSDSKNGVMLRNYYYQNFSPNSDLTLELSPTQNSGTVAGLNFRNNFQTGRLAFEGSVNRSEIRDGDGDFVKSARNRGHIFADGYFDLDKNWRTGFNLRRVSDDYYLRDFDFEYQDVLQNTVYAEYFSGRNYGNVAAHSFQDLRPNITQEQPDILPQLRYNAVGAANDMFGGRWAVNNDLITLFRDGDHSVSRLSVHPSWERRDILPFGIQTAWENKARIDNYWVRKGSSFDTPPTDPNIDDAVVRAIPSTQLTASLPLVRPAKKFNMLIEPKTALTLSPNSNRDDDIPNEDSRDIQIDSSNLFADTRFPGKDRVETGSHVSYGVKFGGYDTRGNSTYATLGQSYRLTERNPFPQGSGLENDRSDYVGQIEATLYDKFYMDYRFQLDEEDFSDRRHELQGIYLGDGLELRTNYVFAEEVQGTGLNDERHQIEFEAAKALTPTWAASVDTIHDLSGESGLLKTGAALQYKNECLRAGVRVERDLTDSFTGGGDSRILFSLGLRNFGGYDTPLLEDDPLYRPFAKAKNL